MIKLTDRIYVDLSKARKGEEKSDHKYSYRESDGKGGWKYYYTEQAKRIFNKFIESIRLKNIEHSLTIDNKGKLLVYRMGTDKRIIFTQHELRKINNAYLSVHNHPNGSSFSSSDIKFLSINRISEIKVVGIIENKKIDYSLKLLKPFTEKEIEILDVEYSHISGDTYIELKNKIENEEMTRKDFSNHFRHYVMENFVKKYKENIKYECFIGKTK